MKRWIPTILLCAVLLSLCGCNNADSTEIEPQVSSIYSESEGGVLADCDRTPVSSEQAVSGWVIRDEESGTVTDGTALSFENAGKTRIAYTGNRSAVRYITDVSALPDEPELSSYDAAYFQSHALLLVTETVSSGSVQVEIAAISVVENQARVVLAHLPPDGEGTCDMATWLLWVEVDLGLNYQWSVVNPALEPATSLE